MLQLVLMILAAQAVILLALRPVILWYLGINRALKALESIAQSLGQMPAAKEARQRAIKAGSRWA